MNLDWTFLADIFFAAVVGGVVSSGELIARYRDEPWDTLKTMPAFAYMLLNAIASGLALAIAQKVGWTFGATDDAVRITQILIAGFGALAIFRSAFFTVRVGDQDVAVGAVSFLQVALDAADRYVDRRRATARARKVRETMENISFDKASSSLPTLAITLMQNLPEDDQKKLFADIARLKTLVGLHNDVKAQVLGLMIMNVVGEDVLDAAKEALCDQIAKDKVPAPESLPEKVNQVLSDLGKKPSQKEGQPPPTTETSAPAQRLDVDKLINQVIEGNDSAQQHAPIVEQAKKLNIENLIDRVKEDIAEDKK